jgi:sugar O-acyltransferase (sialic acid O-acetyltransferase NeuD family)
MKKEQIIIFGTGDIAKLAHYYFTNDSPYQVAAFTVDRPYVSAPSFQGLPLVPFEEIKEQFPPTQFRMFIGLSYTKMNKIRAEKYFSSKERGYSLVSYVSSHCTFLSTNPVGDNCFILEDNTVQPFVKIGNNVTLWSGNHIGHDSVIEDHCFLASQIVVSGNVQIKEYSFIGVNATLRNSIVIARETLIGAGSVIMENTQPQGVYVPPNSIMLKKRSDEINL